MGRRRRLTANEWALIALVALGVLLVLLRWDYISNEVISSVRGYFE